MPAFPIILHRLLQDMEKATETKDIISWNPDGKSFSIHRPHLFVEQIMGRYFRQQTHYKSFQVRTYTTSSQSRIQRCLYLTDSCLFPYYSDNSIYTSSHEQGLVLVSDAMFLMWSSMGFVDCTTDNLLRHPSQDSHPAFLRDDPSLLQFILRTPQKIPAGRRPQESSNASAHHLPLHTSFIDEIQRFSANTLRERQYESHTLPDFILALQPQAHHSSPFARLPSTGQFISLHSEADMIPRSILQMSNPTQTHYTHPSNYSTNRIGSLLTDHDMMSPRPIRESIVPLESIHEPPRQASQISFAAAMPPTCQFGSFLPEAVTTSRISISQEFPQSPSTGHTDTRKKMSLPSIEPSQLNQKNDDDANDNNDDDLSIETIDYEDVFGLQPDDHIRSYFHD